MDDVAEYRDGVRVLLRRARLDLVAYGVLAYENATQRDAIVCELVTWSPVQLWAWQALVQIAKRASERGEDVPDTLKDFLFAAGAGGFPPPMILHDGQLYRRRGLNGRTAEDAAVTGLYVVAVTYLMEFCGMSANLAYEQIERWSDEDSVVAFVQAETVKKRIARLRRKAPHLFGREAIMRIAVYSLLTPDNPL